MSVILTVGICEDDDELRGVLRAAFERDGLVVRATASGSEAVNALTKPFAVAELKVRVDALLRRRPVTVDPPPATPGALALDSAATATGR